MKKLFSLVLVLVILSSCEKNSSETNELLLESENIINKLEKADLEKLLDFFGVENTSNLTSTEMKSSLKSDYSIVVVYDEQFEDNPELADNVVYLEISNEVTYVLNVLERKNRDDISRIEISKTFDQAPIYIIEYDLDVEYSNFISLKSFNDCVDDCVHDSLDYIFNQGSWVRRLGFLWNPAINFAFIAADCTVLCL
jgi:hypothetical protein